MNEKNMLSIDNCVMTGEALDNCVPGTRGLSACDIQMLMISLKTKLQQTKDGRLIYVDRWEAIKEAHTKLRLRSSAGNSEHSISMTNMHSDVDIFEVTVV